MRKTLQLERTQADALGFNGNYVYNSKTRRLRSYYGNGTQRLVEVYHWTAGRNVFMIGLALQW